MRLVYRPLTAALNSFKSLFLFIFTGLSFLAQSQHNDPADRDIS